MSSRAFSNIHPAFTSSVYFVCMMLAALFFVFSLAFGAASSPVLSYIVPKIIHAGYADATAAAVVSSPFVYTFNSSGTLYEAGSSSESSSPYFWLNSGAKLGIVNGVGRTIQGSLPATDPWRIMYKAMNPLDTGNGYYPQNTLRLLTRSSWGDVESSILFRIAKTNLTDTPNRGPHSGIFFMSRHANQHNLYYAGIRHDGAAVIKKKINGSYYTLATVQIFGVEGEYNEWTNPNLLPQNKWMGMRLRTVNENGAVKITLLLDRENNGSWVSILSATDTGVGGATLQSGNLGIRTDFMDVEFDNFKAVKI